MNKIHLTTILYFTSLFCSSQTSRLVEFENFINTLNKTKYYSISLAFQKYETIFGDVNVSTKDSAYVVFDKFYDRVNTRLSEDHQKVNSDFDILFNNYQDEIKYEIPQMIISYKKELNENGFDIYTTEGFTYIDEDRNYISKNFYKYISPVMKEYCSFININKKEGTWNDGNLMISLIQLGKRALWLEKFIKENENFILLSDCKEQYRIYLSDLLNESIKEFEINNCWSVERYRDGLNFIILEYPETETAKLVLPFYELLLNKKIIEAEKYKENFFNKGIDIKN